MFTNNKIELISQPNCSFVSIGNSKLLVVETLTSQKKYLQIPDFICLEKKDKFLLVSLLNNRPESFLIYEKYLNFLKRWLKTFENPFKKRLILKGLGLKINISENLKFLEMKLGFSHLLKVKIPSKFLKISVNKNILIVEGSDATKVGNFVELVRNLKFPDSYKGKGFWYKNEPRILKEIKKT